MWHMPSWFPDCWQTLTENFFWQTSQYLRYIDVAPSQCAVCHTPVLCPSEMPVMDGPCCVSSLSISTFFSSMRGVAEERRSLSTSIVVADDGKIPRCLFFKTTSYSLWRPEEMLWLRFLTLNKQKPLKTGHPAATCAAAGSISTNQDHHQAICLHLLTTLVRNL